MNILDIKPYYIISQEEDSVFVGNNKFLEFYIDDVPLCEYIFKKYNFSIFDTAIGVGALGWFKSSAFEEKCLLKQLLKIPLTEQEAETKVKYNNPNPLKEDIEDFLSYYKTEEIWIYLSTCCGDPVCWGWNIGVIEKNDTFTWEVDENITFEFQKNAYVSTLKEIIKIIDEKNMPLKDAFDW